jgi:Domain of unknown function (DUF4279)
MTSLGPDASAERNMTRWGTRVERESAFWELSSRIAEDDNLEAHIGDIFNRINESLDSLIALRDRINDCQLLMAVYLSDAVGESFGFHLELDQIATLASLRAEVDFEVYVEDGE